MNTYLEYSKYIGKILNEIDQRHNEIIQLNIDYV